MMMNDRKWTAEQERILLKRLSEGAKSCDIADELHFTARQIASKKQCLRKKGLISTDEYGETVYNIPEEQPQEAVQLFTKSRYTYAEMALAFKKQHDKDKAEIRRLRDELYELHSKVNFSSAKIDRSEKQPEILKKTVETYGKDAQLQMAIEKMSELTQALCKHLRGKGNADNIVKKIADVEIMLKQLKLIFRNGSEVSAKKKRGKR